jgi:hypothetical protein
LGAILYLRTIFAYPVVGGGRPQSQQGRRARLFNFLFSSDKREAISLII